MPELPEVERAAKLLRTTCMNKRIVHVDAVEDPIVFSGSSHTEFAFEITNRKITNVGRYGKVFYIELDGEGKMPVLHFGMTGMLQVKGQLAAYYKETPRKASAEWPPRFMKFSLKVKDDAASNTTEIAFLDARRLGRIRLCSSPLTEPPISTLGFDPVLSMPDIEYFKKSVRKRTCPIKALLLDQSFSAGIGNWVADEVLYHSRVHPEERCNRLADEQMDALHKQIVFVCQTAVDVDADDSKFPEDWLFRHRWGKGKKKQHSMKLPDGEPATIKWVTVGGRTSAYIAELQRLNSAHATALNDGEDTESDLTPLSDEEVVSRTSKRKHKAEKTSAEVRDVRRRTARRVTTVTNATVKS